jgi:hypothetical protein
MSDILLEENIRLKQELEALRSLLQKQGSSVDSVSLNESQDSAEKAPPCSKGSEEVLLPCPDSVEHTDTAVANKSERQLDQTSDPVYQEVKSCPARSTVSESSLVPVRKPRYTWSWQDEFRVWREYDPDICEV